MLPLHRGITVQPVRKQHVAHLQAHKATVCILPGRAGHSDQHERQPRPAHLSHHLDIDSPAKESRVSSRAHEEVIHNMTSAPRPRPLLRHHKAVRIPHETGAVCHEHSCCQELPEVVRYVREREYAKDMQCDRSPQTQVVAAIAIAEVGQTTRRGGCGRAIDGYARHCSRQYNLHQEEREIDGPGGCGGDGLEKEEGLEASHVFTHGG